MTRYGDTQIPRLEVCRLMMGRKSLRLASGSGSSNLSSPVHGQNLVCSRTLGISSFPDQAGGHSGSIFINRLGDGGDEVASPRGCWLAYMHCTISFEMTAFPLGRREITSLRDSEHSKDQRREPSAGGVSPGLCREPCQVPVPAESGHSHGGH